MGRHKVLLKFFVTPSHEMSGHRGTCAVTAAPCQPFSFTSGRSATHSDPGPTASAPPANLLETKLLGLSPDLLNLWEWGPAYAI